VLDKGQEDDWWRSAFIRNLGVVSVVSLAAFVVWVLRSKDPIVDLRLLAHANFGVGNLLMLMLGFILLGSTVLLPLFVQALLGYTATDAGLVISPGGLAMLAMMPVVGVLVGRVDARWLIAIGLTITSLGLLSMTRFYLSIDYGTVVWARIFQSMGLAFLFIPINTIAYIGLPPGKNNDASAIINMTRNLGGSFGIALTTTLLARGQQVHQSHLVEHVGSYGGRYGDAIQSMQQLFLARSANADDALHQAQALLYSLVQRQAEVLSFIDVFWLMGIIFLALVPLVLLLRRPTYDVTVPAH